MPQVESLAPALPASAAATLADDMMESLERQDPAPNGSVHALVTLVKCGLEIASSVDVIFYQLQCSESILRPRHDSQGLFLVACDDLCGDRFERH